MNSKWCVLKTVDRGSRRETFQCTWTIRAQKSCLNALSAAKSSEKTCLSTTSQRSIKTQCWPNFWSKTKTNKLRTPLETTKSNRFSQPDEGFRSAGNDGTWTLRSSGLACHWTRLTTMSKEVRSSPWFKSTLASCATLTSSTTSSECSFTALSL